jgi:hypothetical protein
MVTEDSLRAIDPEDIAAPDLSHVAREQVQKGEDVEAYAVQIPAREEIGNVLFIRSTGRAGVAWGTEEIRWFDTTSAEDALHQYIQKEIAV